MTDLPGHAEVELMHETGTLALNVRFTLAEPWTVLFAPSGAGKSTILRLIAGLERPRQGRIVLLEGGRRIIPVDTLNGIFVPPHRRGLRMVTQRPALFPHLSVRDNVFYTGSSPENKPVLELCRVGHLMEKWPHQLSGGERQRVALARTLAAGPGRLLLLDEPFTGLDLALRLELIRDLRAWLRISGTPVLMVTHDLAEVFAAGAEVLRLEAGRIAAQGSATEVLAEERSSWQRLLQAP